MDSPVLSFPVGLCLYFTQPLLWGKKKHELNLELSTKTITTISLALLLLSASSFYRHGEVNQQLDAFRLGPVPSSVVMLFCTFANKANVLQWWYTHTVSCGVEVA